MLVALQLKLAVEQLQEFKERLEVLKYHLQNERKKVEELGASQDEDSKVVLKSLRALGEAELDMVMSNMVRASIMMGADILRGMSNEEVIAAIAEAKPSRGRPSAGAILDVDVPKNRRHARAARAARNGDAE